MSTSPRLSSSSSCSASVVPIMDDAMVIVDPVSTGANVAHSVSVKGFKLIAVFSGHTPPALLHMVDPSVRVDFVSIIEHDPSSSGFEKMISKLKSLPYNIVAVLAGSELGVECSDALSNGLSLPLSNSLRLSCARRDKYLMGETVRSTGVRAVQQARVSQWEQVESFIERLNPSPFKVVIKPVKSAGSDNVYLCESIEDLHTKFNLIVGTDNALGIHNDSAVVQEYLQGTEYVVDTVSRNGHHKVIAIWAYDKRSHMGSAFVYHGMSTISADTEEGRVLFEYQKQVLNALEICHGPAHGEIILTSTGPCLVEIGARPHGGEGTFIIHSNRVWGYNQVDMMVDAYISQESFDRIPERCDRVHCYGFKVYLVSHVSGKLVETRYLKEIHELKSFMRFDAMPHIGDEIHVTRDCFTMVGSVMLANEDPHQLERDHLFIRKLEPTMFHVIDASASSSSSSSPSTSLTSSSSSSHLDEPITAN